MSVQQTDRFDLVRKARCVCFDTMDGANGRGLAPDSKRCAVPNGISKYNAMKAKSWLYGMQQGPSQPVLRRRSLLASRSIKLDTRANDSTKQSFYRETKDEYPAEHEESVAFVAFG
jgi:hypothetical protein